MSAVTLRRTELGQCCRHLQYQAQPIVFDAGSAGDNGDKQWIVLY